MNNRKLSALAMLVALAYASNFMAKTFFPIPLVGVSFLKYDPKDIFILFGGFVFGPLYAAGISLMASSIQAITTGTTGGWGFLMDIIATLSFVVPAAFIYRFKKDQKGVIVGVIVGIIISVACMTVANIIVTPIYTKMPRDKVIKMLLPAIIPFNLIKTVINASAVMVIYKKVAGRIRLFAKMKVSPNKSGSVIPLVASIILVGCIIIVLQLQ